MERRKFNLEEDGQLALPLPTPRKRLDDDVEMTLRVPKAVAAAVKANPKGAVKHLQGEANKFTVDVSAFMFEGVLPWSSEQPPCSGFWDVKQKSARTDMPVRPWFDAERCQWVISPFKSSESEATRIDHETFMKSHQWRGLKAPAPQGYTYPLTRGAVPGSNFVDLNPHAGHTPQMPPAATRRRLDL